MLLLRERNVYMRIETNRTRRNERQAALVPRDRPRQSAVLVPRHALFFSFFLSPSKSKSRVPSDRRRRRRNVNGSGPPERNRSLVRFRELKTHRPTRRPRGIDRARERLNPRRRRSCLAGADARRVRISARKRTRARDGNPCDVRNVGVSAYVRRSRYTRGYTKRPRARCTRHGGRTYTHMHARSRSNPADTHRQRHRQAGRAETGTDTHARTHARVHTRTHARTHGKTDSAQKERGSGGRTRTPRENEGERRRGEGNGGGGSGGGEGGTRCLRSNI